MIQFADRQGKEITLEEWGKLHQDHDYRTVAKTDCDDGGMMSTVWLGLNHNYYSDELHIFETAFFDKDGECTIVTRYATEEEAKNGHNSVLALYRVGISPKSEF